MNKIIGILVVMLLIANTVLPIVSSENKNVSIQVSDEIYVDDEGDGDVERWAIAMGFAFDGIMEDAYCLRDILHNNTPTIWPTDHIKLYSYDSWDNIIDGLRWIESQEDSNDITIWQSAGHGNPNGLGSENGFISYSTLDSEFDKFDGSLLIMICACGSCTAHAKLDGDNRIIITGRAPLNFLPCKCQKSNNNHFALSTSLRTYFIWEFVNLYDGAWGNEKCDLNYGNQDNWVSAEEAFRFVNETNTWPDEIWNNWCFAHLYMTDRVPGNLDITYVNKPPITPTIDGHINGKAGQEYLYNFTTTDPDEDDIYYLVDWGDNQEEEFGLKPSGEPVTASHAWEEQGTYIMRVKAKDVNDLESDWTTLEISMPKYKLLNNNIILEFINQHPRLLPIVIQILGL